MFEQPNAQAEFQTGAIRPVEVYKEAWELIKNDYWMIFLITFVGLLIANFIPIIIVGPMICGIYIVLFRTIDGHRPQFEDMFKGFEYFLPSLVVSIITAIPVIIFVIAVYIPMVLMAIAGPRMSQGEVMPFLLGMILLELIVAVVMICIHTLLIFAYPLMVERKLGAIKAMTTSGRAVMKNLGGIVGLFTVGFLLTLAGMMLLCIGVYLTIPIILAANAVATRKVFPKLSGGMAPPPPNYYQGL